MNDLVLSEDGQAIQADEYHDDEDWYETRPGSEISSPKNEGFRPIRGQKSKYLIILGIIVVAVGFFSLSGGKKEEDMAVPATPATSVEDGVFDYVSQFVDKKTLLEDDTYTNSAYNWLLKNSDIEIYGNSRIRQRFALASIYYATNEGLNSWDRDDGWITDQDECTWDGVRCENGNIIGLNLTSNGLTGVFPMEITMLKKHLLALEISDNELTNEDQQLRWIGKLTTLRLLDFEDTDFTADGIPTYIGELTDLRKSMQTYFFFENQTRQESAGFLLLFSTTKIQAFWKWPTPTSRASGMEAFSINCSNCSTSIWALLDSTERCQISLQDFLNWKLSTVTTVA